MKDSQDRRKIITGRAGEAMAADFLKRRGYRILEMNYRCSIGEIDMVAREKDVLVFVEVKTRKSGAMGYPEQAVGLVKQKKCLSSRCGICGIKISGTQRSALTWWPFCCFPPETTFD